jgi:hypothetical protein
MEYITGKEFKSIIKLGLMQKNQDKRREKMKKTALCYFVFFVISFLFVASFLGYSALDDLSENKQQKIKAQKQLQLLAIPKVDSVRPKNVRLNPGGKEVSIVVRGRNLNFITSVQMIRNKKLVEKMECILKPTSPPYTSRRITLKALPEAKQESYCQLRLIAGSKTIDVDLNKFRLDVGIAMKAVKVKPSEPLIIKSKPKLEPQIKSVSSRALRLEPGQSVTLTIKGSNLDQITSAQVLLNNRPVREVKCTLGPLSAISRVITLKASSKAKPGRAYSLQLKAKTKIIQYPSPALKLEISPDTDEFRIDRVEPMSAERSTTIRIFGNGFLKRPRIDVDFMNNSGTYINQSGEITRKTNTLLEVIIPPGAHSGPMEIASIAGSDSERIETPFSFTVLLRPIILEFNPTSGSIGTVVEIKGINLRHELNWGAVIKFQPDQRRQLHGHFKVGEMTDKGRAYYYSVAVPEGAATGPITALNPYGSFSTREEFTVLGLPMETRPRIDSFSPESGEIGTEVTLFGRFDPIKQNNTVEFRGNTVGQNPFFSDGSTLKIRVPPESLTGPIKVLHMNGTATSADTFYLPPEITRFDVNSGPVGFIIRIYGQNFDLENKNANIVRFNDVQATVVQASHHDARKEDVLRVEIPSGATSGPVTIQTPGGIARGPQDFTIINLP